MDGIWIALLSGTAGAALTALVTVGAQLYFTQRAERRQGDKDRVAIVLEFTGQARAMVIWATYVNAHATKAAQLGAGPAILLRQLQPFDLRDMASSLATNLTTLMRAGGHLVANEGGVVQAQVDDIISTTVEIVVGYLDPVESRMKYAKWFSPVPPVDHEHQKKRQAHLATTSLELERLVLAACSTLKGAEVARRLSHRGVRR